MKKLGRFKSALLTSAVALSVLASPAKAVKREDVKKYFYQDLGFGKTLYGLVLDNLEKFDETQWEQFKNIAQSLTEGMSKFERNFVIEALGMLDSKILFHTEFTKGIATVLNFCFGEYKTSLIHEIAKHGSLFQNSETFSYHDFFQQLIAHDSVVKDYWVVGAFAQASKDIIQNENFFPTLTSLMTPDMGPKSTVAVIAALGKVTPEHWPQFVEITGSQTKGMKEVSNRADVIFALGKVTPEKWDAFFEIAQLLTESMKESYRTQVIEALGGISPTILFHREFSTNISTFLNMLGDGFDTVKAIQEIAKHQNLFQNPGSVSYYDLFRQLRGESSLVRKNSIVQALSQVSKDIIQDKNFFPTLTSLITLGMDRDSRDQMIEALGKTAPKIFFHPVFSTNITIFLNMIGVVSDKVKALQEINKHLDLFRSQPPVFPYYYLFQKLIDQSSAVKDNAVVKALSQVSEDAVQNEQFYPTLMPLITAGMNESNRAVMFSVLGRVESQKWDEFVNKIAKPLTEGVNEPYRTQVIAALSELNSTILFHREFSRGITAFLNFSGGADRIYGEKDKSLLIKEIAKHRDLFQNPKPFSYYELFQKLIDRASYVKDNAVVKALSQVSEDAVQNEQFFPTLTSLITRSMCEDSRVELIKAVGNVHKDKMDLVYGQIQRLMRETSSKIRFTKHEAVQEFIKQLQGDKSKESQERVVEFTTVLIQFVNGAESNVDDDRFSALEGKAWARMWDLPKAKTQALANQGQKSSTTPNDNTSHEEPNARGASTQNVLTESAEGQILTPKRVGLSPYVSSSYELIDWGE